MFFVFQVSLPTAAWVLAFCQTPASKLAGYTEMLPLEAAFRSPFSVFRYLNSVCFLKS
jgi:hypothetical protein